MLMSLDVDLFQSQRNTSVADYFKALSSVVSPIRYIPCLGGLPLRLQYVGIVIVLLLLCHCTPCSFSLNLICSKCLSITKIQQVIFMACYIELPSNMLSFLPSPRAPHHTLYLFRYPSEPAQFSQQIQSVSLQHDRSRFRTAAMFPHRCVEENSSAAILNARCHTRNEYQEVCIYQT